MLIDDDDPVSDIRFILQSEELPLKEQISRAITEIGQGSGHRSVYFAGYLGGLLFDGSESETAILVQSIENAKPSTFSEPARVALLGALNATMGKPSTFRLRLFVSLTARYLMDAREQPRSGGPGISLVGLLRNVCWILNSEAAEAVLRGALPPSSVEQLGARIAELKNRRTLSSQQLSLLERFLSALRL